MHSRGRRLVYASAGMALLVALPALLGKVFGWPELAQWGEGRPVMSPVASALILLLASLLLAIERYLALTIRVQVTDKPIALQNEQSDPVIRLQVAKVDLGLLPKHLIRAISLMGLIGSGVVLIGVAGGFHQIPAPSALPLPHTLLCLLLLFLAAFAATYQRIWALMVIQVASLIVLVIALSAFVGHLLEARSPVLMGFGVLSGSSAGMPLPAAIALFCLGGGFMVNAGRDIFLSVPVRQFSSFGAVALLLLSLGGLPVMLGWLVSSLNWDARYGPGSALALLVVANIILQLPVILHVARRLFFKEHQLKLAVTSLKEAVSQKDALAERLRELSRRDALTGLHNRRAFEEEFKRAWRRAMRTRQPLALLYLDIDHFKRFNDHYGHIRGDACLSEVAARIQRIIGREGDLAARIGGEEFVLLLPETTIDGAECVARKMHDTLTANPIEHLASPVMSRLTVSIGIAAQIPARGDLSGELLDSADQALYSAKQSGRNRTFVDRQSVAADGCATL
ncbi:diguanylate cyclase (GGDEF)-like protein [Fluviicoccus keumensis]|uniref:diguanylate cyclase n=2 Tax=Fluviicoccus keumensis TaxID=1435465 RepID=A0A4Q7YE12_9GAMM|nr:diguanylate cyclase (GGDEF)-like protein [Fluviicoccus keumensis]